MGIYDRKPQVEDFELEGKDDFYARPGYGGKTLKQIERAETKRKAANAKALIGPGAVGSNEMAAVEAAETVTQPLALNGDFTAQSPTYVARFEAGYNAYTSPMRHTLYSMGRVKDLQDAGAPLTPAELKADKKLAKKFTPLNDTKNKRRGRGSSDGSALNAFNQWSETQSELNTNFDSFLNSQRMLEVAVQTWNRARQMMQRRAARAEKSGKTAEKKKIEAAADTLVKIVSTSTKAWGYVNTLNSFASAGMHELKDTSGEKPELGRGLITAALEDAGKAPEKWSSRTQKVGNTAGSIASAANIVNPSTIVKAAKSASGLSLRDVFIVMMGDAGEYDRLEQRIALLNQQIAQLDESIEVAEINNAWHNMQNFQWDLSITERKVTHSQLQARKSAKAFNLNMNGGTKGLMAMYACEAYQELHKFGAEAHRQVRFVNKMGRYTDGYAGRRRMWMEAEGYIPEIHNLRTTLRNVYSQKKLLDQRAPEWADNAVQWRVFLATLTKDDLMTDGS